MHTDDDSLWSKVKRKLQPALAAVDQLIEARERAAGRRHVISDLHARQHGTRDAQPWSLRPSELATARRIGSLAPHERSGDDKAALLGLLRASDFFLALDPTSASAMAAAARWHEFQPDELVFAERAVGDAFFLVVQGTLAVLVRDDKGDKGDRRRPRAAKPAGRVALAACASGGRCGGGAVLKLPLPVPVESVSYLLVVPG